jgi:hypothetical protein
VHRVRRFVRRVVANAAFFPEVAQGVRLPVGVFAASITATTDCRGPAVVLKFVGPNETILSGVGVRTLRRSRQNQLVDLIENAGLQPGEFGAVKRTVSPDTTDKVFPVLVHETTGYYFIFAGTAAGANEISKPDEREYFESIYEPGLTLARERIDHDTWDAQLKRFAEWLEVLRVEADPTDIWNESRANPEVDLVFALDAWVADEPFQPAERDRLSVAWREIEKRATDEAVAFSVPADVLAKIHARFVRLEAKLDKQSKRDWVGGAMYALFGIVKQCGLEGLGVTTFLKWAARLIATALRLPVSGIDPADHPRIGG